MKIADAWVSHWAHHKATGQFSDSYPDADMFDLVRESPFEALEVIFEIMRRIEHQPESELFQVLAAGPVEDLLGHNGASVIKRVEAAAESDPAFKLLLGGVWKGRMSPDIWARVQRARGDVW